MPLEDIIEEEVVPTFEEEEHAKTRKMTTFIVYGYCLLLGAEYSAVVLSLFYYLKEMFEVKHIALYYSLTMTGMAITATITAFTSGYYIEKRKSFRKLMLVIISITIIGNLLYSLHFSVWFIIFGRSLCGLGEAICTAATAELTRIYSPDDVALVLSRLESVYVIGYLMGPGISLILQKVDFNIGILHITTYNAISLFLMVLLIICNLAVFIGVSDLPDSSWNQIERTVESTSFRREKSSRRSLNIQDKIRQAKQVLFRSYSVVVISLSSAILNYTAVVTELAVPMIANIVFKWTFIRLSIVMLISIAVFVSSYLLLNQCFSKVDRSINLLFIACLLLLSLSLSMLLLMKYASDESTFSQSFIIFMITLINSIGGATAIGLSKKLFLQMVPSQWESRFDGFRVTFYRILGVVGYSSVATIIPYLDITIPLIIILLLIASIALLVQKKLFEGNQLPSEIKKFRDGNI